MRICFIGNSHAGAWKRGWKAIAARYPHVSMDVFASPATTLKYLERDGTAFTTANAQLRTDLERSGAPRIDTAAYDLFVLVLVGFAVPAILRIYKDWRADSHKGRQGDFTLLSDACFRAASAGRLEHGLGGRLCRELAAMTTKPIFAVPPPMPREGILRSDEPQHKALRLACEAGDDAAIGAMFEDLLAGFCKNRAIPLPQPRATLRSAILTEDRWAIGARRLFGAEGLQPKDDFSHMNDEYGTLCLADLFAAAGISPA